MAEDTREVSVAGIGHPLADRVGGGGGDAWVVTESRARVIFLNSSKVNLLATAARDGRRVVLVTDENSLLTPVLAASWRQAGGGWAVREVGGGIRDGFDGRRLSSVEDAGRLPSPTNLDDVAVNFLRPIAADALQLTAFLSMRHPARETTMLGTPVEWLADAALGAPPRLWGTHEPLALAWNPTLLTQTIRDSVIARHIRAELTEAGLPVLQNEMQNRVAYPEASLWGATPSLISWKGPAAREIAAIADELDMVLGQQQVAA